MSDPLTFTCQDFERLWNERLDARGTPLAGTVEALQRHAAGCSACQALDRRFHALERLLMLPGPSLKVPDDFTERVLAAVGEGAGFDRRRSIVAWAAPRRLAVLAAAAVVLVGVTLSLRSGREARRPTIATTDPAAASNRGAHSLPPRPADLSAALSDATSATLALAWQASAPAARVGREVLSDAASDSPSSLLAFPQADAVVPTSEVMQDVGERVNAGVRPLSGTARSAFSFLIVPASRPAPPRPGPTTPPRGA